VPTADGAPGTFAPWDDGEIPPIVAIERPSSELNEGMTTPVGVAVRLASRPVGAVTRRSLRWWALLGLALVAATVMAEAMRMPIAAGHLIRCLAALAAVGFSAHGWRAATGRARAVRGWLTIALAIWLVSELVRLVNTFAGRPVDSGIEFAVIGLAAAAARTYVCALRGRLRPADEAALYLDAAIVFSACAALLIVFGGPWFRDPDVATVTIHLTFFVSTLGATAMLDLATRAPLRVAGPYGILIGLALGAVGYLGLLVVPEPAWLRACFDMTLGAGALVAGYGAGAWTADEDHRPAYEEAAQRIRHWLPLVAVGLAPMLMFVVLLRPVAGGDALRLLGGSAIGIVVLLALARQTFLLRDREQSVTRERSLRADLAASHAQYRSVVDRVPGAVYVADVGMDGRWHYVSPSITEILGYTPEEWLADPDLWEQRLHPADHERMLIGERASAEPSYSGSRWEYRLIARDGREVWVLDDEEVISRDAAGRPVTVQGILVDISDRKNLEEQLRHQALHDPLTGLPNRVLFADRVTHALARRGGKLDVAVLFLDLDDFKGVNDSLGHGIGDDALRQGAERIASVLRPEDTACRLGGDEFACLLEDVDGEAAVQVAERILIALRVPFALGGHDVVLRASIGVAVRSRSDVSADQLLRDADNAMYAAKALGKGRVQVFTGGMDEPILRRLQMRTALEVAVERDELRLAYQPIVEIATGRTIGVEALVRWLHPELGRIMPGEFIPLAEDIGLIGQVGAWVLETACRHIAAASPIAIASVNVSAHQLGSGDLPGRVASVLASTGLAPGRLLLELTESTLAAAGHGAEVELAQIHELGVRIALDDFGSGYSSLEYLGRLPVDVLKVDRSLVARIDTDAQRRGVLAAVGQIARELHLDTIVEGVERLEQRRTLLELGFTTAQGYLLGMPSELDVALPQERRPVA
jgi:diguanylate cyclase (GGDEF)-like protein/PAS domain S-box-containing protein